MVDLPVQAGVVGKPRGHSRLGIAGKINREDEADNLACADELDARSLSQIESDRPRLCRIPGCKSVW
jgi:hypothetical protein